MSEASVQEARARSGYEPPKSTRTYPVDLGGCPLCGHLLYTITGSNALFCPCEDCHSGGIVVAPGESLRRAS